MCSCNLPDASLVALLTVFAARGNEAFSDMAKVTTLGEVQDFFKAEDFGGPSRAILAFREAAAWHKNATREGSTDMSEMPASKKLRHNFGADAPTTIMHHACQRSVERMCVLQAQLPARAARVLNVLLDPRRPDIYKEGLTCEEPNMLKYLSNTVLGNKADKPKGIEVRDVADMRCYNAPYDVAYHLVHPRKSFEEMRSDTTTQEVTDTTFEQVDLTLPMLQPEELEAIAEIARGLFKHMARGILSAPPGVRAMVTKRTEAQVAEREKARATKASKKAALLDTVG